MPAASKTRFGLLRSASVSGLGGPPVPSAPNCAGFSGGRGGAGAGGPGPGGGAGGGEALGHVTCTVSTAERARTRSPRRTTPRKRLVPAARATGHER
jgi:hypothetical protein